MTVYERLKSMFRRKKKKDDEKASYASWIIAMMIAERWQRELTEGL